MTDKIIDNSIKFLANTQERNGSFPSYTSLSESNFKNTYLCESVFSTALILSSISKLDETPELKNIKRKAVYFLLSQKTNYWTFNYWDRRSKDYLKMPYPDDLDDTSCSLAALFEYNPKLIDGDVMAKFVTLLTNLEVEESGPYKSWITHKEADKVWHDVDLAVNSNIAFFLSLFDINLKGLSNFIESSINSNTYKSPYYTSPFPIIYFISRSYKGKNKENIINFLLKKQNQNSNWGNPLFTALSYNILENFSYNNKQNKNNWINYLLNTNIDGKWPAHTFYLGINPTKDSNKYHAGSEALTTSLCLEAIAKHKKNKNIKKININKNSDEKFIKAEVINNTKKIINTFDTNSQIKLNSTLQRNLKTDKTQPIVLLPYLFTKMLRIENNAINNNYLITLGEINLQGWMAYSIYDDILDNDGGDDLLSGANILSRQVLKKIHKLIINYPDFKQLFENILDKIDTANSWERNNTQISITKNTINLKRTKLPKFNNLTILADKSLGHAIGPIAVLMLLGYCAESSEIKNISSFFKHYIIARQLNDDAHDWEDDLRNGQITYVVKNVLTKFNKKEVNIKKDLPSLQKIFWHESVAEICSLAIEHTKQAENYLNRVEIINNPAPFNNFLISITKASEKALKEREQTLSFLNTYKKIEETRKTT